MEACLRFCSERSTCKISYRGRCGCVGAGPFYACYRPAATTCYWHAARDGFAQDSRKRGGREYVDVEAAAQVCRRGRESLHVSYGRLRRDL